MRPLTEKEVAAYLEVFDLREKLIASTHDLRRPSTRGDFGSSLEGACPRHHSGGGTRIYKRVFDTPKNGKKREGGISDGTLRLLRDWAELAQDPSPDGFVFPSENLRTPLAADNLWRRHMQPKLKEVGLEWAVFRFFEKPMPRSFQRWVSTRRFHPTRGATGSGSAWRSTRVRTSSRSEQQSENSKQLCFEHHVRKADLRKQSRLNGINGITRNQWVFLSC